MTNRIMVVDDDAALRMTLQDILMEEGWDVIAAEDGFQAIKFATERQIAVIFMDIQMPGMNGVEAFLKIKKILPECVVVMITGFLVESLVKRALAEGAMTVLLKPLSIEELLKIVEEVVSESIA